ncbi:MAG: hypothetical protein N7Q72_04835 [Spiroplasma sp. Tabriz.8]|nr:hypothetical protein [Spiroplasma sp. Tabriz.8]
MYEIKVLLSYIYIYIYIYSSQVKHYYIISSKFNRIFKINANLKLGFNSKASDLSK